MKLDDLKQLPSTLTMARIEERLIDAWGEGRQLETFRHGTSNEVDEVSAAQLETLEKRGFTVTKSDGFVQVSGWYDHRDRYGDM